LRADKAESKVSYLRGLRDYCQEVRNGDWNLGTWVPFGVAVAIGVFQYYSITKPEA
jgi:hypothetical protein